MKITKLLYYLAYIGLAISLMTLAYLGFVVTRKDLNTQEIEKNPHRGTSTRSTTITYKLPMNLEAKYYLRVKDGEILVDSYFLKIQKKYIPKAFFSKADIPDTDYPNPIEGQIYTMPESESFLFIQTPFSTIEKSLTILKIYFILIVSFLVAGIFFTIKFLKNCNKGHYFIPKNSTYLRMISYLAVSFSLLDYIFQWLIMQEMNSQLEDSFSFSLNSGLEFNWNYLIFSIFLVMIAQAFTEGTKLKEEQSLTI
jgi:hypothetical protein